MSHPSWEGKRQGCFSKILDLWQASHINSYPRTQAVECSDITGPRDNLNPTGQTNPSRSDENIPQVCCVSWRDKATPGPKSWNVVTSLDQETVSIHQVKAVRYNWTRRHSPRSSCDLWGRNPAEATFDRATILSI
ncbi:hypothetical protein AAFF_G00228740 [Aldrovandia affinis]|uniref:Uncharacterized protein n=1 Tax=Aldrovandia affinis TaxID=143900 RepID=A0AAD7SWD1_9TELE|nr:hypothetical protein AAFF_G00228740 [Aldrovandia affinis]